jgi:hypothetical protein
MTFFIYFINNNKNDNNYQFSIAQCMAKLSLSRLHDNIPLTAKPYLMAASLIL